MKVVILAAGKGERMYPLTESLPKCMLCYKGKPIIDHILERLDGYEVYVVVGHKREVVEGYLEGKVQFVYQDTPSGEAGAVLSARRIVGDESFLVHHGDVIIPGEDIKKVAKSHC
jgi:NDP-sugar pyrophosphorylase family protein